MQKHVKIGEIEVPINYFELDQDSKDYLINGLIEVMIEMLHKETPIYLDRIMLLRKMFESSIITNLEEENFEIVQILHDCLKKIDG